MRIMTRLIPRSLSVRMNGRMLGRPPAPWPSDRWPRPGNKPGPSFPA
jgi:hypothetical protein